jgi:hypothetical protein
MVALPLFRPTDMGSFGRIICTALLAICYWYSWRFNKDIPATLLTVLQAMLMYMFGTKVYDGVTNYQSTKLNLSATASVSASTSLPVPAPATPATAPAQAPKPVPASTAPAASVVGTDDEDKDV